MSFKIYMPEVFQGDLKNKRYFEGWYFKHVSSDLKHVWSFIPGISLSEKDRHSFIQVMDGTTGYSKYISYPVDSFLWDNKKIFIKIGNSVFTENYIDLKIDYEDLNIEGHIDFKDNIRYPKSLLSPGIMGWYSFVPFMECKHGIISVNHVLSGSIRVNSESVDFNGGNGYIEKDWGTSFPEAWLCTQANNFGDSNSSFTFSVAKIPWRGKFFIGFISLLYYMNKFHVFSTYNNSVISHISHTEKSVSITLKNKNNSLKIEIQKSIFGELKAPVLGDMSRKIKESIDSEVKLILTDKNDNTIYSDISKRAGLEVIDKIFDYF